MPSKPFHTLLGTPAHAFVPRYRATKGLGRTQPAAWQDAGEALEHPDLRGCHMPKGPGKDVADPKLYLQYNEVRTCVRSSGAQAQAHIVSLQYIVYDASQIRLRYLLMVKMQ